MTEDSAAIGENRTVTTDQPVRNFSNRRQICAIFAANLYAFSASMLFNWTSPSIPKLLTDKYPKVNEEDVSYLPMIPPVATILTSPTFPIWLKILGRKYSLLTVAVLHLICYVLFGVANEKWTFFASRAVFGISDTFMLSALPIYVAEVSTPNVRGIWAGSIMIFMFCGQFCVNAIGYFFEIPTAAWMLSAAPITFFAIFIFMPETPYHYLWKNDHERAAKSLRRLRDSREDIESELMRIEADIKRQISDKAKFKDLFTIRSNRNAFFIVFMTFIIEIFSGCPAFSVYCQFFFQLAGKNINLGYAGMICAISLAVATMCGPKFVEKVDRRIAMVTSCMICAIVLTSLAIYFAILLNNDEELSYMRWYPLVAMAVYFVGFGLGQGVVPFMLQGELFATNMRGYASSVTLITLCTSICVTSKLLHYLMTSCDMYVPFTFFATCSFLGSAYCYKFIPEIKGKTLEEIQELLKQQSGRNNMATN